MSKGQHNHARQPVSRVKGRETSQPRNPAGSGKPGGSSFIKSRPAQLPPGSGKQAARRRQPDVGAQPGNAPVGEGRRDPRAPQGQGQDFRRSAGQSGEGRRDPRAPQGQGQDFRRSAGQSGEGRRDPRAPQGQGQDSRRNAGQSGEGRRDPRAPQGQGQDFRRNAGQSGEGRRDPRAPQGQGFQSQDARHAPKVARAKKMLVRDPGQQVLDRAKRLRETRVDFDHIEPVRLQKALAQSGVGSRREMEEWIEAGLVMVNGQKATLGDKVGPHDRVSVKGDHIKLKWADRLPRVILYHKQEGEIVSRDDPKGRVTIFDRLPQAKSSRWVAVGRLDVNTSGLLILTTSGELANNMMHPSFEVEREYAVRVLGELTDVQRREMCQEIQLEDGPAHFDRIVDQGGEGANHWYRVVIKEGRNREVRRMFEYFGLQVSRLMRVRFGQVGLPPRLKRGKFYELNEVEVAAVMKWAHLTMTGGKAHR